jgi:hypothetical protein
MQHCRHLTWAKGEIVHSPAKLGPERNGEQGQVPTKPSQLRATPPWAKSRISQKIAQQSWINLEQAMVSLHPHQARLAPALVSEFISPCPTSVSRCSPGSMYLNDSLRSVCSFHMGVKHISKDPLLSNYKRRTSSLLTTTHKGARATPQEHHSKGSRPTLASRLSLGEMWGRVGGRAGIVDISLNLYLGEHLYLDRLFTKWVFGFLMALSLLIS